MVDDKILVRVRQLIALATRNPEKEEARTAAVQACALIVEHKIDELFRTNGEASCSACGHKLTNVLCSICARDTIFGRWRRAPTPQPQPTSGPARGRSTACRMCGASDTPLGTVVGGYCNRCRPFGEWGVTCAGCGLGVFGATYEETFAKVLQQGWRGLDGRSYCRTCAVKL